MTIIESLFIMSDIAILSTAIAYGIRTLINWLKK